MFENSKTNTILLDRLVVLCVYLQKKDYEHNFRIVCNLESTELFKMSFKCYICCEKLNSFALICDHLKIIHMIKDNCHEIKCVVDSDCKKTYATFKSLRAHVKTCRVNVDIFRDEDEIKIDTNQETMSYENMEIGSSTEFNVSHIDLVSNVTNDSVYIYGGTKSENIDDFLRSFTSEIVMLGLNMKSTDAVFKLCEKLVNGMRNICLEEDIETVANYITNKLQKMNTQPKRDIFFEKNDNFVRPEEKSIGVHWEMRKDSASGLRLPTQIQSKYQFVSITKTLISLFEQENFKQMYMEYNSNNPTVHDVSRKHICQPNRYKDFCCSKVFKDNKLFMNEPNSVQIQLFIDGFELCDPLKSKATIHSQVGVYFAIRNLPHRLAFNQNNIHLVAMCYANDLKTKQTDYNNLWEEIVRDISFLERAGIILNSQNTLKGTKCSLAIHDFL